ncbi:MAG: hypothetical protein A4S14_15200 [Proteobacteria bacterium SG_bin9]|nr:MAG: hypothetical protein A4S14_15200 [Proteobacteria bacterium SG_bin9]
MIPKCTRLAVVLMLVLMLAPGCVLSKTPLLDDRDGVADPDLTGEFTFTFRSKTETFRVFLKGNKYLLTDQKDRLTTFASLHRLKDDVMLVQKSLVKGGTAPEHYEYLILRKTPKGFEVGSEDLCDGTPGGCEAKSRDDLLRILERQLPMFLADEKRRVAVLRK